MNTRKAKNLIELRAPTPPLKDKPENLFSWVVVLGIAVSFLLWGIFVFFMVGISWPPPWRYGTVADVPGQSVYGVQGDEEVRRQHVMGRGEEKARLKDKGGS
jgi:hypothetical protein